LISVAEPRFSSVDKLTRGSEEPVRLCNYIDVYSHDYITGDLEFMRASATQPEIDRFGLKIGDVIITKDSETPDDIGIPTVVDYAAPDLICGYHLALLRPDQEKVDPTFLAKQLKHVRVARYFGQQSNGLTRYGLPIGAVNNAPLWLPELDEQKAVGKLLRLMDDAIAKTAAVIAKLRQVRAGLLHDLLTRGIDENGELRDPIGHPELFQPSPLGRIPRAWDIKQLRQVYETPSRNGLYKKASSYGYGHRMIHMPQMFKGVFIDVEDAVRVNIDPQEFQRYALREGDLLFARRSLNLEGAGLCSMVGKLREPATFESSIVRVRVKPETVMPRFAVEFLRSPAGYLLRRRFIRQVAVSGVSGDDIAQFLVPCPKPSEQECILSMVNVQDNRIRLAEHEAAKLAQVKSGLMNDLLTGRVRVPESIGATA